MCDTYNCTGLIRCIKSKPKVCIHISEVCDGKTDYLSGDDEQLCNVVKRCPPLCHCFMYAVVCKAERLSFMSIVFSTDVVFLKLINIQNDLGGYLRFGNETVSFIWSNSGLKSVCSIHGNVLQLVDYSFNNIQNIEPHCFSLYENLKILFLNNNKIKFFKPISFDGLTKLIKLDISKNCLIDLFLLPNKLNMLNISYNKFDKIELNFR